MQAIAYDTTIDCKFLQPQVRTDYEWSLIKFTIGLAYLVHVIVMMP